MSKDTQLIDQFQQARKSKEFAVIEGVQALKHAARFKAELTKIITCDKPQLEEYLNELAPDVIADVRDRLTVVTEETFTKLSPQPPRTKVIALGKRTDYKISDIKPNKPIVFLEDPKDLENIGAVIRVAAAADAGAVITSGMIDIWHPGVMRGAAGLQFALPVLTMTFQELQETKPTRKVLSLDPTGKNIRKYKLPENAILIFGTERHGITQNTLSVSDEILSLPMKKGVSSLNLATSVAAPFY